MGTTGPLLTRTLIWLTVAALPLQAMPASTCPCNSNVAGRCLAKDFATRDGALSHGLDEPGCCCCCSTEARREGRCCCRAKRRTSAAGGCCSHADHTSHGCQCGPMCRCGMPRTAAPVVPPASDNPTEKLTRDVSVQSSTAVARGPRISQWHKTLRADVAAVCSLQRCIALCRFTL